jgi:hypothetical protein
VQFIVPIFKKKEYIWHAVKEYFRNSGTCKSGNYRYPRVRKGEYKFNQGLQKIKNMLQMIFLWYCHCLLCVILQESMSLIYIAVQT